MLNAAQMIRYREARANGSSIDSAVRIARGDYDKERIALDWDGYDEAEASVDGFRVTVKLEPDYDVVIADHNDGAFSDEPEYRLLPWGGKRRWGRRYVLASALTKQENDYRERQHEASSASDRRNYRDEWSPWYTSYGIAGGLAKGQIGGKRVHDTMDYLWRRGYSKSDAYLKAMQDQREEARRVSGDIEYYGIIVTVARDDDELVTESCWGFDVDGYAPRWQSFNYIKDEAARMAEYAVQQAKVKCEEVVGFYAI